MIHFINPTIDCVFKAILGAEAHEPILIHFLNAMLNLLGEHKIRSVILKNPYNAKDYMSAKDTIVDVKATDNQGKIYQIEIQTSAFRTLKHRMLYTWSHVYKDQLQQGDRYQNLHPVISIWLLSKNVISEKVSDDYHHHFEAHDIRNGVTLSDHFNIHIIELPKWEATRVATPKQQWLYFFKEGGRINADSPPDVLKTSKVMVQAMDTLRQFSDQEDNYDLYQARQAYILEQNTIAYDLELALEEKKQALEAKEEALEGEAQALKAKEQERKAKEQERKAKEQERKAKEKALAGEEKALRKKGQLEALLKKHGIDPNEAE